MQKNCNDHIGIFPTAVQSPEDRDTPRVLLQRTIGRGAGMEYSFADMSKNPQIRIEADVLVRYAIHSLENTQTQ